MRWAWGLQHELRGVFGCVGHQGATAIDDLTLWAGPSADAAVEGAAGKVSVALGVADFFDHAFDANHAFEFDPMELQRGKWVAAQLQAFAAAVVGVPNDAALVQAFDQHDARAWAQVAAHRGQGHGVGLGQLAIDGLLQPLRKLLAWVGVRSRLVEFGFFVAFAQVGDVHASRWMSSIL